MMERLVSSKALSMCVLCRPEVGVNPPNLQEPGDARSRPGRERRGARVGVRASPRRHRQCAVIESQDRMERLGG